MNPFKDRWPTWLIVVLAVLVVIGYILFLRDYAAERYFR